MKVTIVGAGCCVLGAGLADYIFVDLAPFIFIVTAGKRNKKDMIHTVNTVVSRLITKPASVYFSLL